MFDNIGSKMKTLAKTIFWIETVAFLILGLAISIADFALIGIAIIIVGPLVAWISSWFLYGFGEVIDYLKELVQIAKQNVSNTHQNISSNQHGQPKEFVQHIQTAPSSAPRGATSHAPEEENSQHYVTNSDIMNIPKRNK